MYYNCAKWLRHTYTIGRNGFYFLKTQWKFIRVVGTAFKYKVCESLLSRISLPQTLWKDFYTNCTSKIVHLKSMRQPLWPTVYVKCFQVTLPIAALLDLLPEKGYRSLLHFDVSVWSFGASSSSPENGNYTCILVLLYELELDSARSFRPVSDLQGSSEDNVQPQFIIYNPPFRPGVGRNVAVRSGCRHIWHLCPNFSFWPNLVLPPGIDGHFALLHTWQGEKSQE